MRSAPLQFDPSAGTVALFGSGAIALSALRALRSAGANVRWFPDEVDVAEELLLASAPPGGLELSLTDPLQADYSEFVAVVAASQTTLDRRITERARALNVPIDVIDHDDLLTFKLAVGGDVGARRRHHTIKDIAA